MKAQPCQVDGRPPLGAPFTPVGFQISSTEIPCQIVGLW